MKKISKFLFLILAVTLVGLTACVNITVEGEETPETETEEGSKQVLMNVTEQYFEYEDVPYGPKTCLMEVYNHTEELEIKRYVVGKDEDGEDEHFMVCSLIVTNNEAKAGTWEYSMTFEKASSSRDSDNVKKEIDPGETETFEFKFPQETYGLIVSCTPKREELPKIEKCKYQEPITYKRVKVVKNRTVEKLVDVE